MVLPCSCRRANSAIISSPVCESRLPVGSSAKQNGRVVHQRARNRHALALAAGKLIGLVHHAFGQIHLLQRFSRTFQAFFGRSAVVDHRQFHIVQVRSRAAIN